MQKKLKRLEWEKKEYSAIEDGGGGGGYGYQREGVRLYKKGGYGYQKGRYTQRFP